MSASRVNSVVIEELNSLAGNLEQLLNGDLVAIQGPILFGLDRNLMRALEEFEPKSRRLNVVINTGGGVVEVAERMVQTIRHFYSDVSFVIPDRAMSAGTVLAMSGDSILMDYFSCLGPIDPQVEKDGKLVPALSYLEQFNRLIEKAKAGELTSAEASMMIQLDLAELHTYEQARELTHTLLVRWLTTYKFKDWQETESRKIAVTSEMKQMRASEIAMQLSDNQRWHSHGRGISMDTLKNELNLRIDDFGQTAGLASTLRRYVDLIAELCVREQISTLVHTRKYI